MTFKSFIDSPCGIRYMFDTLTLQSPCGRKMLLESKMLRNRKGIEESYGLLKEVYDVLICKNDGNLGHILSKLHCLRDITTTVLRLKDGAVLDDIELFEIKYLALISEDIREVLIGTGIKGIQLANLKEVMTILDPDKLKIASFYVYDSYSSRLREIRKEVKRLTSLVEMGDDQAKMLFQQSMESMGEIEGEIRGELSGSLKCFASDIDNALKTLGLLDILLAKGGQINELGLCFPSVSVDGKSSFTGMFHPQIKKVLEDDGKKFTLIDIEFGLEPVTIIGANMGGKSVVLKMLALSQLLFQFGFGLPAKNACVDIKEGVIMCIGDEQNIISGLSSFAAEMKGIDGVLKRVKRGERVLALIDEPARTTNPVEGTALVNALLRVLYKKEVSVLLTTHYNIEGDFYKRLRVRGLKDGVMDYRLQEAVLGEVPHEAVEIAESLGIDMEWIGETKRVLKAQLN